MAVNKVDYLDQNGVLKLSTELLKCANSRIKERILTSVNAAAYNDDEKVLSAKAILGITGSSSDAASASGTLYARIAALVAAIGTSSDTASDSTVYGAIANAMGTISSLTHLTYQPVTGAITSVTTPDPEVLYLQQDDAQDTTWNLYIWNENGGTEDPTTHEMSGEWICVGETSATLQNYWGKDDTDTNLLISTIMGAISDNDIATKVAAAFAATDPFDQSTAANAYAPTGATGPTGA